ncbi:MAG: ABC transporter permease [Firmicutes bacterium]|nr:ABC transporter permease [Bacillota bacterium]
MNEPSTRQKQYLHSIKKRRICIMLCRNSIILSFIVLWQFCSQKGIVDSFIFSSPKEIVLSAVDMTLNSRLLFHTAVTACETIAGFILGTFIGTGTAIILWWNSFLNDIVDPYLVVLNSIPKTALAPIIIVWVGNNISAIIAVALLTSVIVSIMNILTAFNETDKDMIKLIYTLGGNKKDVLFKVILPANVPAIMNALKVNTGLSFIGTIIGEMLVAKYGLGYLIIYGSQIFRLDIVLLSVVILALLSTFLYKAIMKLEKKINSKII